MATGEKAPGAFRTIGELSSELGVAQHILRYWETQVPATAADAARRQPPLLSAGRRRACADASTAC